MPKNQAKGEGNGGQNHTNFGSIIYAHTPFLVCLSNHNHIGDLVGIAGFSDKSCFQEFVYLLLDRSILLGIEVSVRIMLNSKSVIV